MAQDIHSSFIITHKIKPNSSEQVLIFFFKAPSLSSFTEMSSEGKTKQFVFLNCCKTNLPPKHTVQLTSARKQDSNATELAQT